MTTTTAHHRHAPHLTIGLPRGAAWQAGVAVGIAALALGVIMLVWPTETMLVAAILFGLYLVINGVLQIVSAFAAAESAARVLLVVTGGLTVILGLLCFRSATQSVLLLGIWIGVGWLVRGVASISAASALPSGEPGRGWVIGLGVITAAAGIVLMVTPIRSLFVLTVLGGVWLVAVGVAELFTALRMRRLERAES